MSRDVRKRLQIAIHQIEASLQTFDRILLELSRCRNDLHVTINAKKTDFYRCKSCEFLREKGESCSNQNCKDFGGKK